MSIPTQNPHNPAERLLLADKRIEIIPNALAIQVDNQPVDWATPRRVQLFAELAKEPDTYVPLPVLTERMYGDMELNNQQTIRVYLSQIRRGLGDALGNPKTGVIRTQQSVGYCAVSSLIKAKKLIVDEAGIINSIASGRVVTDGQTQVLYTDRRPVETITLREFEIAHALTSRPGRVLHPQQLKTILEMDGEVNSIQMHISNIRAKLGPELGDPRTGAFRTQRGVGYYAVRSL